MKSPLPILFVLSVSVGFAAVEFPLPQAKPVSDEAMLAAIAEVETGNNPARLGSRGERTRLQILPATWRQFSQLPHSAANRAETDRVARAYLSHIRTRLKARGLPETPFFIAAGWNAGPGWKRLSRGTISYAERVANLAEVYQLNPPPSEPAPIPVIEVPASANQAFAATGPAMHFEIGMR